MQVMYSTGVHQTYVGIIHIEGITNVSIYYDTFLADERTYLEEGAHSSSCHYGLAGGRGQAYDWKGL